MDVRDPATARAVTEAFRQPMPIEAVEDLEVEVKRAWAPIAGGVSRPEEAFSFSQFFAGIGFVRKYKPYGTKFASPFGFSIFDLEDGRGFSIQLHRTAKVEAFVILAVGEDAFVLISSVDEWRLHGEEFLRLWAAGAPTQSPLAYRPQPGDVIVVKDLEVVHSIVGCVLEEFATTSNDAVERLHDQNRGHPATIPAVHASVSDALTRGEAVVPTRLLTRTGGRWRATPVPDEGEELVSLPEGQLRGGHLSVDSATAVFLEISPAEVATLACLEGAAQLGLRAGGLLLRQGELAPLAPGEHAVLTSLEPRSRVAVCRVAAELAFADLR